MIRMGVPLLIVAVGDDDLGLQTTHLGHQAGHRFILVRLMEAARIFVSGRARHTRIPVAQLHHLGEPNEAGGLGQFGGPHCRKVIRGDGAHQRRIHDVSQFTPGTAHQRGAYPLGGVAGHGARPLGRFVVGMGMNGEQREWCHRAGNLQGAGG